MLDAMYSVVHVKLVGYQKTTAEFLFCMKKKKIVSHFFLLTFIFVGFESSHFLLYCTCIYFNYLLYALGA